MSGARSLQKNLESVGYTSCQANPETRTKWKTKSEKRRETVSDSATSRPVKQFHLGKAEKSNHQGEAQVKTG